MRAWRLSIVACLVACGTKSGIPFHPPEHIERDAPGFSGCVGDSRNHEVFNSFWRTLDDNYAVFDARLNEVTWRSIGSAACPQIRDPMSREALFDALLWMARQLDDGHTTIRDEDAWVSVYPHYEVVDGLETIVEQQYADEPLRRRAQRQVAFGWLGAVAYLSLRSMDELSSSGSEFDDVRAAQDAMDEVFAEFGEAQGMIVDIRANEGGWDEVSLTIAQYFSGERRIAWREQERADDYDSFGPAEDVFVESGGAVIPVVLLTSGGTFSAAETFALAMRVRDDVRLLGERTSGHFSDLTDGRLPNGWRFTYSGERYTAPDGELYEATGVPVDIEVALSPTVVSEGRDPQLEEALRILE